LLVYILERVDIARMGPSLTSQAVAVFRAGLDRPHSADGDPDAQRALCAGMHGTAASWFHPDLAARTRFFDDQLLAAVSKGVSQIVIIGAGYDDRALRFRAPGVRFFEMDHPDTQADKARRLASEKADVKNLNLVPADFRYDDLAGLLTSSGHDQKSPSLFICEGVIVYLDEATARSLLEVLTRCATPESTLAASLATHPQGIDSELVLAKTNAARLTGGTEPWRTILPLDAHLALISDSGWCVDLVVDSSQLDPGAVHGRSVFVTAHPE
jgi:methyltransferase (TIGR00027 family)